MIEYFQTFDLRLLVRNVATTVVIILAAFVIWAVLARSLAALERHSKLSRTLLLPLRMALRYALILVTLLLILSSYGVPIGNFWTFVSTLLGLIAIGFVAVWSMLSNVSATFFLMIFRPFRVGDYVRVVGDDVKGDVIDINFMFTTLRTRRGDLYKVPNNMFFQKMLLRPAQRDDDLPAEAAPKAETPDHSQANLEGIPMPRGPK